MPDKDTASLRDVIFHQYAKLITRSAFKFQDSKEAKRLHYGFVKKKLQELMAGVISWSEILREDLQFVEAEKKCIYCGSEEDLHREHLVPKSLRIKPECGTCDKIQGIHI